MSKIAKNILHFLSVFALMTAVVFGGLIAKFTHKTGNTDKKDGEDEDKSLSSYLYSGFPVGIAHADVPAGGGPSPSPDPCPAPAPGDPSC